MFLMVCGVVVVLGWWCGGGWIGFLFLSNKDFSKVEFSKFLLFGTVRLLRPKELIAVSRPSSQF